jgi:hypothetical protein
MPTRSALIFSALCAVLASIGTFFVVEREGDPEARLQLLRKSIGETQGLLDMHTAKVRPKDGAKPQDPARAGYLLEKPDGTKLTIDAPKTVTPRQLEIAADLMVSTGRNEFVLVDSAWKEAEGWWKGLTWLNRSAAERMTLARFPSKPESASSYDWDVRHREAEFTIEEALSVNIRRTGWAVAALVAVFVLLLLILAVFGWLWRALLARVRELSQAMRGEPPR